MNSDRREATDITGGNNPELHAALTEIRTANEAGGELAQACSQESYFLLFPNLGEQQPVFAQLPPDPAP